MSNRYRIPDNLTNWKWPRHLNPYYPEVKAASAAWARSFGAFSPKAQYAYDRCDFTRVRTGCDLMNMFFVYDEYSDVAHEDEVQVMADIIMDALRNPHKPRPKGEWIGGEVTRQFWELAIKTASPGSQKRFIEHFGTYTQSVVQQAADRTHKHVRTIQEYLEVRRDTIGAKPSFVILETPLNLPEEAVRHPIIEELSILSIDMILLGNVSGGTNVEDIASYNLEQARGDDNHNMITIVMHHNKTDVQGAMDWVYNYHKELEAKFMDIYENKIPRFGEPVDTDLAQYVDGLGNWVRASDQWGFESERYFGKKAPEIQKTRWVTLLPKERSDELGPQLVDGSLL
ncbi:terpenoid synthase [Russula earlei]|uniref:Terpenoid synthase n=1 Tax=Russula earlei TaxID=71964 RepID=A0ACC0TY75_9AGAM|nr:terpenoid synthase [Russula earlei]